MTNSKRVQENLFFKLNTEKGSRDLTGRRLGTGTGKIESSDVEVYVNLGQDT